MVFIEGMEFDGRDHEQKIVHFTVKSFYIDRTMVTNEAYLKCVEDKKCKADYLATLEVRKQPLAELVTDVSGEEYCAVVGKRLPTSPEWQLAARGKEGRKYPWGNEDPKPATTFPHPVNRTTPIPINNVTPEGVEGMAGVLWQYTSEQVCYVNAPKPELCDRKAGLIHGGAWNRSINEEFESTYTRPGVTTQPGTVGVRCAKSVD
jgi:formylglycine-generating enzyme required for sulfatase activity